MIQGWAYLDTPLQNPPKSPFVKGGLRGIRIKEGVDQDFFSTLQSRLLKKRCRIPPAGGTGGVPRFKTPLNPPL
jgi:hypothetical protein